MAIAVSTSSRSSRPSCKAAGPSGHRFTVAQLDSILTTWSCDLTEVADRAHSKELTVADLIQEMRDMGAQLSLLAQDIDASKPRPNGAPPLPSA